MLKNAVMNQRLSIIACYTILLFALANNC